MQNGPEPSPSLSHSIDISLPLSVPHSPSLSVVGLGQPVDSSGDDELVVPDLPLQKGLQLVDVHLGQNGPGGAKHPQHGVDALQGHAVQVRQHGLDVGPEELRQKHTGPSTRETHACPIYGLHPFSVKCGAMTHCVSSSSILIGRALFG